MSLKRTSRAQLLRPRVWLACMLLLGLGGAVGCGAYPTLRDVPINCSVEDEYEFDPNTVSLDAWCANDGTTPGASATSASGTITGGGVCKSSQALVFYASHNNDWGSVCGFNNFGMKDEHTYDGLSFWARDPGNTSKGFTISLYDANTTAMDPNAPNAPGGGHCKSYYVDGGTQGQTIVSMRDPVTDATISGPVITSRMPDECGNNRGNGYDNVMLVTSEWAFYTVPWGQFTQWAYPNRVPNSVLTETGHVPGTGLLTTELKGLGLRPPKEMSFELWIAKLGFYRKKQTPDAGQR
jgi:hypothetical protein